MSQNTRLIFTVNAQSIINFLNVFFLSLFMIPLEAKQKTTEKRITEPIPQTHVINKGQLTRIKVSNFAIIFYT